MKTAEYLIKSRTTGLGLLDTWRWDRRVVPKRRYGITTLRWLIPHNSVVIMYHGGRLKSRNIAFRDMSLCFLWLFLSPWIRLLHSI